MFHFFKQVSEEREITKEEVEQAVAQFLEHNKRITYTVLVNEDYTINYKILKPYLPATPTNSFLVTRETLEIFEDSEINKHFVKEIDAVQRAVDLYVVDKETFPIIDGDSDRKISSIKLRPYLGHELEYDLYISEKHFLVTSKPDPK